MTISRLIKSISRPFSRYKTTILAVFTRRVIAYDPLGLPLQGFIYRDTCDSIAIAKLIAKLIAIAVERALPLQGPPRRLRASLLRPL